jgi:hypothetical protein
MHDMEVYAAYAGANRGPIARITSRSSPAGHVVEVEVAVAVFVVHAISADVVGGIV